MMQNKIFCNTHNSLKASVREMIGQAYLIIHKAKIKAPRNSREHIISPMPIGSWKNFWIVIRSFMEILQILVHKKSVSSHSYHSFPKITLRTILTNKATTNWYRKSTSRKPVIRI